MNMISAPLTPVGSVDLDAPNPAEAEEALATNCAGS